MDDWMDDAFGGDLSDDSLDGDQTVSKTSDNGA